MDVRLLARESLALLLAGIVIVMGLAMVSYSPADPSWNHVTKAPASNMAGIAGAYLADFIYQLFGYAAWIWLVLLTLLTVRVAWGRKLWHSGWTSLFWLPVVLSVSALLQAHLPAGSSADLLSLKAGSGGALGMMLEHSIHGALKDVGRDVLLITLLLSSGVTASHWSLLALMKKLYEWTCNGFAATGDIVRKMFSAISHRKVRIEAREERNKVRQTRNAAAAAAPAYEPSAFDEPVEPYIPDSDDAFFGDFEPELTEPVITKPASRKKAPEPAPAPRSPVREEVVSIPEPEELKPVKVKVSQRATVETVASLERHHDDNSGFELPSLDLFDRGPETPKEHDPEVLQGVARSLESKLLDYRVDGNVVAVQPGPVVTQFELEPAPGTKVNRIVALQDDLARSMAAISVRVAGNIPGKNVIGIEIPNHEREMVVLHQVLASPAFANKRLMLPLGMGVDISGNPVVSDLAKMPHLLVAGTTGSGKSVAVNAMICSMLMARTPEELRMILVDPKMLELSVYDDIPHLLVPVVTNPHKAAKALAWAVYEMERRYQLMSDAKVRNIDGYNKSVEHDESAERLPMIVIVIDELADLMMVAGKEVEQAICRIAQKARAAGLHLILATQRPSVDVITGLIKANLPSRLSFQVSSKIDSRTILDQMGAEQLLGHGDSLFLSGGRDLRRVHGAFVSDAEVLALVEHLKGQGAPDYREEVFEIGSSGDASSGPGGDGGDEHDEKYDEAAALVIEKGSCSVSMVQRYLRIGYNRASRLVEQMEREGLVSPPGSGGLRKVLARSSADGGGVIE
ncbi:DNA translocase FtsK [Mariprofundus erugo]|uniref:DNA translocase FtsK n=1 Tax=Mariprofundus erugo TaxID=2528639 RepID=A0A5R9GPA1_9PROT|nr:DNA translocase FtsK [Mariprofundus erugo]TLS67830.1 DNA translocase FtsK [Mariprofundus erugo]